MPTYCTVLPMESFILGKEEKKSSKYKVSTKQYLNSIQKELACTTAATSTHSSIPGHLTRMKFEIRPHSWLWRHPQTISCALCGNESSGCISKNTGLLLSAGLRWAVLYCKDPDDAGGYTQICSGPQRDLQGGYEKLKAQLGPYLSHFIPSWLQQPHTPPPSLS